MVGASANTNFILIGVATGTNSANPSQTAYSSLQSQVSGAYYAPLCLNPGSAQVLINKNPATSITGAAFDLNGTINCTNLISSNNFTLNNVRILATISAGNNHYIYYDPPQSSDAIRQLIIRSNSNNNLFLSAGVNTGTI